MALQEAAESSARCIASRIVGSGNDRHCLHSDTGECRTPIRLTYDIFVPSSRGSFSAVSTTLIALVYPVGLIAASSVLDSLEAPFKKIDASDSESR